MRSPLTSICIVFCLGILTASCLKLSFLTLYLSALLFLACSSIFIKKNIRFNFFILCVVFLIGILLFKNSQILPSNHIAKFTPYKGEKVHLTGVVDNDPAYKATGATFALKVSKIESGQSWRDVSGKILVRVSFKDDQEENILYGDKLLLKGKLFRPFDFSAEFSYIDYLERQDIYSILSVKKESIERLGSAPGNFLKSLAFGIRHRIQKVFTNNLSVFSAGILNAVILGERQNLPRSVREDLIKSGSVHVIAISGLHVGIVTFIALLVLKIMRIPRKPRYIATIATLIVYCFLSGAKTPVTRATIMAIVLLFGYLIGRESKVYNSLSFAALIILAANPRQLFDVSFQLSFLSVISIVWLAPRIKGMFPQKLFKIKGLHFLILAFSVSASAWLGLVPLIAYYFRAISPIAVLANIIIVPYMSIVVASALSLALMGMMLPTFANVLAAGTELIIAVLFKVNSFFINLPVAYFKVPRPAFYQILLYYVLLTLIFSIRIENLSKWLNGFKAYLRGTRAI